MIKNIVKEAMKEVAAIADALERNVSSPSFTVVWKPKSLPPTHIHIYLKLNVSFSIGTRIHNILLYT